MPKTTYVATAPNGAIFTRKSERNYTHAVVYQQSYEGQLREYGKVWKVDKSNFLYAVKIVARVPDNRPGEFHTKAEAARLILQGMDIILENAKRTRRQALRVLAIEKSKGRA